MILTKTEFSNEFKFNSLSSVSHLLKAGTIVANDAGLIDTNAKENKAWIKRRRAELRKEKKEKNQISFSQYNRVNQHWMIVLQI